MGGAMPKKKKRFKREAGAALIEAKFANDLSW